MDYLRGPVEVRLWRRVTKTEDCWLWTGPTDPCGYGRLKGAGKASVAAHRLSYELANGAIPKGVEICHRCDNPRCVNPAHLFAGTHKENMADMARKGRSAKAPTRHLNKLTADQVCEIRERFAKGETYRGVAAHFGIGERHVYKIVKRQQWAWVP